MTFRDIYKTIYNQSPRQIIQTIRQRLISRSRLTGIFDEKHPCVFVLSTGRAGTETLGALFSLVNNVISYHEPSPIMYGLSKISYENYDDQSASKTLKEAFLAMKAELLNYSLDCRVGYIETSPQNTFLAKTILNAIPNATFIHMVRDPRDVIRSGMRRKWFDGHPNDGTRIVPRPNSLESQQWNDYSLFQKNVWLWNETNRWIMDFTSSISSDTVLRVRSEDVFSRDQKTLQALYGFIGAKLPQQWKIERVLHKKMNAQWTGEFPTSALWSADQKMELINMASETAGKLGYNLLKDNE
jgi:hypothetical protein